MPSILASMATYTGTSEEAIERFKEVRRGLISCVTAVSQVEP